LERTQEPAMTEAEVIQHGKELLRQVELELQDAAAGARSAADALPNREQSWSALQKMYTRFQEAEHLIGQLKKLVPGT
jgi:hypothetical protein